jgi:hypothetical protein
MNKNLVFFNKEGDYLNIQYNSTTERYEGDLLFHENSSDTFKTIGLYLFENVPSFEFEIPGSLVLEKFQLFNEYGLNFTGNAYQTQSVTKLEAINNDSSFYSKWIYGVDFEKKYPIGSQIIFDQPFVEFTNMNQSFTVVATKKGATMIISNVDNQSFNTAYSTILGMTSSYDNISISGVNSVGVYNYVDSGLNNQISSWSEPDFYLKYFEGKKLNLVGTQYNDRVVTIKNNEILDKAYYTYYTDGSTLTYSSTLIAEIVLKTDLPLVYTGGVTIQSDRINFVDLVPSILKPGTSLSISNSVYNQNFISIAPIYSFLGNVNLTWYATQSQVTYNNRIYECIQAYTQSATSSVTPNNSNYWTDNITYLPVNETLVNETLGAAQVYLTTNRFQYSYGFTYSTEVTLASFADKYKSEFEVFNINLFYDTNTKLLNSDLIYSSKYADIIYTKDYTGLTNSITNNIYRYENIIQVEETLTPELNSNISERWSYNIVFTDIDEYGIKVVINGMLYQEEVKWVYTGLIVDMTRTIDKTLRSWISKYYVRLFTLGIISKAYYSGNGSSVYYNSINLTTQYPNVPIEFDVEVGTTADFYIQHSNVIFYDLGINLEITINNLVYGLSSSTMIVGSQSLIDIPSTLSNWVSNYKFILDDYGIYINNVNNNLTFDTKKQDQQVDYTIRIGKSSLPGEVPFEIKNRYSGNQGPVITSNSMKLPSGGTTYSFLDSGFSTGMVITVNNTLYPFNNQQYNILYVDGNNINFSYQGPFWATSDPYCDSSPFTTIAFSLGFGATACIPPTPPPSGGGEFDLEEFQPSFSLQYQSNNYYQQELFSGTLYMVDITYVQVSDNMYVLGGSLLSVDASSGQISKTISLGGNTQSVCLRFNPYNNYLYALTKDVLYAVDPIIDTIIATMSLTNDPFDCVINDLNGDIYVSYSDINKIDIWNWSNTYISYLSPSDIPYYMAYHPVDNDVYVNLNNDIVTRIDGTSRSIASTYSVTGLTSSILYEPSSSSMFVFGNYLTKIDIATTSVFTNVQSGDAYNFSIFDNLNGNIVMSISGTSSTVVMAVDSEGVESWSRLTPNFGHLCMNQFDGDIYMSSEVVSKIVVIDSVTGQSKHTETFASPIRKTIYNPSRNSIWGLQAIANKIVEVSVTLGSTIQIGQPSQSIIMDGQYGTLDPNYVQKDYLWIKTSPYIRRPRQNYQSDNSQVKLAYKWRDDQTPQMFMYDFTGNQLTTSGPLSYTGEKPLPLVTLNRTANKNIEFISYSEYQQTIFGEIVEALDYIDSETSLTFLPEPLELFLGFNSDEEGTTTSTLQLFERENISLIFTPSQTNYDYLTFTLDSSGTFGTINLYVNSPSNFLFDINGDKTGLKVGQHIKLMISDVTNSKNKFISYNNAKTFKIKEIYTRSIIVQFIDDVIVTENNVISDYPKSGITTYLKTTIKVVDKEIGRFNVMGQTEVEDERYRIELSNTGKIISSDNVYIFKEYDINEEGIDWTYLNKKRKEMLMVRSDIFPYVGSYKAIINAINYFGYNDLELYEYYRNINGTSENFGKLFKVEIPDIFDNSVEGWTENDFIKHTLPNANFEDTNLFNLTYKITDKEGNNLLTYSLKEVLMKLQGLKYWLQSNVIPLTHRILDITGRADFVGVTSIIHKSYDTKIINVRQNMSPVDFSVTETYLMPVNSGSTVYNVVVDFNLATSSLAPDYFDVQIRTYKTYKEWSPFYTYNQGDRITYYQQLYESEINNNRINNPREYENVPSWDTAVSYDPGQIANYRDGIYEWIGTTGSTVGVNPVLDTDWLNITNWRKIDYIPVQTIKEYRTGTHSLNFTVDSNIDPFITIEVTSDNGYGQTYTSKRNYEIRGIKDLVDTVMLVEKDPLPVRLPAPPSSLPAATTTAAPTTTTTTLTPPTTTTTTAAPTTTTTTAAPIITILERFIQYPVGTTNVPFYYNVNGCNLPNPTCFPIFTGIIKPAMVPTWTAIQPVPMISGNIINVQVIVPVGFTGTLNVEMYYLGSPVLPPVNLVTGAAPGTYVYSWTVLPGIFDNIKFTWIVI